MLPHLIEGTAANFRKEHFVMDIAREIQDGKASLGIELGSTRIKAVLIASDNKPAATGIWDWENRLENGIWTYSEKDITNGLKGCYASLLRDIKEKYGVVPKAFASMGISAMMHGYIALDKNNKMSVPFRTWRNTMTATASKELTELFSFPIPQRWSIAHLYQCILNGEPHLSGIEHLTTLAGYVHFLLTGKRVLGIGEASGMFPVSNTETGYNKEMAAKFDERVSAMGFSKPVLSLLPDVLTAGSEAGRLTKRGAALLDESGALHSGILFCPPEGDAGTGMVATNSLLPKTGNVSAGTSVFAMIVLDKPLSGVYDKIDIVATPDGKPVAMVHCNNCTSEINAWADMFSEFAECAGMKLEKGRVYEILFKKAFEGRKDCEGMFACNYLSGEHITGFESGRPLFARKPDCKLTLADFMRVQLYTSLGALKTGLDILTNDEKAPIDKITGHGGFFKTEQVGQKILAAAVNAPVSVMKEAGEGGAWGMALLAKYMIDKYDLSLDKWLCERIFKDAKISTVLPCSDDVSGFNEFMNSYSKCLDIEKAAIKAMP